MIKEKFYKRKVFWRKAYVSDLFFSDMKKAMKMGVKENE